MSRTDELRNKFRKKAQESIVEYGDDFFNFSSRLNDFVMKMYNASTINSDYAKKLYDKYKLNAPSDLDQWLEQETRGVFRSIFDAPKWVREPTWCFHEGVPLHFIHQFEDDSGNTFYIFRGNRDITIGNTKVNIPLYKMCGQSKIGSLRFIDNLIS